MDRTAAFSSPGPCRCRSLLGRLALLASLPLLGASPLRAAPEPPPFPPAADFRSLQLITLTCSRENSPEPCERARRLADPLLDHPRLPASCKDVLWSIRKQAVVASSNSFERRQAIDQVASRLTAVCRQQLPTSKQGSAGPASPQGGLKLIGPPQN